MSARTYFELRALDGSRGYPFPTLETAEQALDRAKQAGASEPMLIVRRTYVRRIGWIDTAQVSA